MLRRLISIGVPIGADDNVATYLMHGNLPHAKPKCECLNVAANAAGMLLNWRQRLMALVFIRFIMGELPGRLGRLVIIVGKFDPSLRHREPAITDAGHV